MKDEYWVDININWFEKVKALSEEDAITKMQNKYIVGYGHIPREYIEVCIHSNDLSNQVD